MYTDLRNWTKSLRTTLLFERITWMHARVYVYTHLAYMYGCMLIYIHLRDTAISLRMALRFERRVADQKLIRQHA